MKYFSSTKLINGSIITTMMIAILIVFHATTTEAVLLMRVTFAKTGTTYKCSPAEGALIAKAIDSEYYLGEPLKGDKAIQISDKLFKVKDDKATKPPKYRRNLRRNVRITKRFTTAINDRSLQSRQSLDCKSLCAGKVSPYCHVTQCAGSYRRLENESEKDVSVESSNNDRILGGDNDKLCQEGIERLNDDLDDLLPQLSALCRPLVQNYREVACFDDSETSMIESFTLWDTYTDTAVEDVIVNGDSFCSSTSPFTILANSNSCVSNMQLKLEGPIKIVRNERGAGPYSVFGFDSSDLFIGKVFPVGKYTITGKLAGSGLKDTQVSFTIRSC
jgi:hypothetical protein